MLYQGRAWPAERYHRMLRELRVVVSILWKALYTRHLAIQSGNLDLLVAALRGFRDNARVELFFQVDPGTGSRQKDMARGLLQAFEPFRTCRRLTISGRIAPELLQHLKQILGLNED